MRRQLSLRSRLLLAVGAISLAALFLADVVVYSSLSSYLYGQVDTNLETSHRTIQQSLARPAEKNTGARAGGAPGGQPPPPNVLGTGPGGPGGTSGASVFCALGREAAPGMFVEIRSSDGAVVTGTDGREECPAFQPGSVTLTPVLPKTITGYAPDGAARGELAAFFTTVNLGGTKRVAERQQRNR